MLTITISGERGEGKTFLAWIIKVALGIVAPKYDIEYKEGDETNSRRMQGYYERENLRESIKNMEPRKVQLVVEQ